MTPQSLRKGRMANTLRMRCPVDASVRLLPDRPGPPAVSLSWMVLTP
ncbi:hypothetical protein APASM_0272 [Actinosynnema pretiosum subsp. pretiosum]|nr:hypothetical protein APASM_0272 [Actinosynnema pretiosum subsp. pretiosum]